MWFTTVFLLFSCYSYVNTQFMPPFSACGRGGSYKPNLNCPTSTCSLSFPNIGCNSGCPGFIPIKSRFSFPTFCRSNFNSAKCSSVSKDPSLTPEAPTSGSLCSVSTVNKTCPTNSSDTPSQLNCSVAVSTSCPNAEATTAPPVVEPSTTTAAPAEAVVTDGKEVVESVVKEAEVKEKVEEIVDHVKEVINTTTTCAPCDSTTESSETITPTTSSSTTCVNNATASCEPPAQVTCATPTPTNSSICAVSQRKTPILCKNVRPCVNQSLNACPINQLSKSFPIQRTSVCENTSQNQCLNNFITSSPNQYVKPCSSQYSSSCSNQCFKPYLNQCSNLNRNQFLNPCPIQFVEPFSSINPGPSQYLSPCPDQCINDYPKQFSNPNVDEFWNPCPTSYNLQKSCPNQCAISYPNQCTDSYLNQCPKPNVNQLVNPCSGRCIDPLYDECISPCPDQLNSCANFRNDQFCLSCRTPNICSDQLLLNNIPCELSLSQNPNIVINTCNSEPNARVEPDILLSQNTVCDCCNPNGITELCNESPDFINMADPYPDNISCDNACREPSLNVEQSLFC